MKLTQVTLTLPDNLPRWTVPTVLLLTLALEVYDVWNSAPPTAQVQAEECADICYATGQRMGTWAPAACVCVQP